MQYSRLKNLLKITGTKGSEKMVTLPLSTFNEILRAAVHTSPHFDDKFYYLSRPDVAEAVRKGSIPSAREHFAKTGYFEDLMPGKIQLDEAYYLGSNADVAQAFREKKIKDPQLHFEARGYVEGRLPMKNFAVWKII